MTDPRIDYKPSDIDSEIELLSRMGDTLGRIAAAAEELVRLLQPTSVSPAGSLHVPVSTGEYDYDVETRP